MHVLLVAVCQGVVPLVAPQKRRVAVISLQFSVDPGHHPLAAH